MVRTLILLFITVFIQTALCAKEMAPLLTKEQIQYLHMKKTITICVDPKWRPYEWIDKQGKYKGMGADYFSLFTKNLPAEIVLHKTKNWAQTIKDIKEKKCDLLPMAGITKERKKFLNFTSPYYFAPYVVATTLDKSFIEDFSEKLDKKYAVIAHSAVIDDLNNRYGNIRFVTVDNIADGMKLVSQGKVFGFINTAQVISFFIQERGIENIKIDAKLPSGYHLAVATRKDELILRDIFERVIKSIDPQELAHIKSRWYGVVLETRKDYTLFYKIVGFLVLVLLALLYRALLLKRANLELEARVEQKTVALQKLNAELEEKVEQRTKALEHQAYYDALTNLPNRRLFKDRLHLALAKSKRSNSLVALYFIDLDMFKQINDSLGHHAGDKVLKIVAKRLSKIIRKEDTLARLGGDEFTLLVESAGSIAETVSIAQKMLELAKEPIEVEDHTLYISLSIGIALAPQDATNARDLLKNADAAMYKAKEEGRNNFQFYSPQMSKVAYEKIVLQSRLRQAIDNKEFDVYYQPQVDVVKHKIVGFEALVRWIDPKRGVIEPDEFIGVAQETGMIVEIDKMVQSMAIEQFAKWHKAALCKGRISINLASKELSSEDYLEGLIQQLDENSLKAEYLEIEITEGEIMRHPQEAIIKLQKIHDLGIRISIDDFGTGYSSLAYLKRFPIDKLKIDQSFVEDIPKDEDDCAIVKAVIALGENLGLSLVAEGVETKEQEQFLVEHGCRFIQGHLYAKAMSAQETEEFLRQF
jgi:diguanylate cyclase (GGDEF)-like protein